MGGGGGGGDLDINIALEYVDCYLSGVFENTYGRAQKIWHLNTLVSSQGSDKPVQTRQSLHCNQTQSIEVQDGSI